MKIALASDCHIEFGTMDLDNTEDADVLILSGDIMIAEDLHDYPRPTLSGLTTLGKRQQAALRFYEFLDRCSIKFPHVVYIAGNHEFYHGKWHSSLADLMNVCADYPNIHFLENSCWDHNDYCFIGGTLWPDMNKADPITLHDVGRSMNDFNLIRDDVKNYSRLKPQATVERHRKTLKYFRDQIDQNPDKKYIVVGHHTPSVLSIDARYRKEHHTNGAYHSDLSEFIMDRPAIKLWTCGHTHHSHWYYLGSTLVACNPRGYIGYEASADQFKIKYIDLGNMPSVSDVEKNYSWQV